MYCLILRNDLSTHDTLVLPFTAVVLPQRDISGKGLREQKQEAAHLLMTSTVAVTSAATADAGAIGVLEIDASPKNSCSRTEST